MRYYKIDISDPTSGTVTKTYTSFVNGKTDPGALLVELDVQVAPCHVPVGASYVRVWGVSLQDIGQASDLNGKGIAVYGGFQKGLPLANPAQAGLLFQGQINQAFGNWQDTTQTLDLYVIAGPPRAPTMPSPQGSVYAPVNLSFQWPKGSQLTSALGATLRTAFPTLKQNIKISPNLVFSETATGYYETLGQFSNMLNAMSRSIIGGTYRGVFIAISNGVINVYDDTIPAAPIAVAFNNLIGQVTWFASQQITFKTMMRWDLAVGTRITLPPGQVATTAASLSQYRQGSIFQGTFLIDTVRHVGNSRNPSGDSWVSVYEAHGPV